MIYQTKCCPTCGEYLIGDGYSVVLHCPNVDTSSGYAPDSNPVYCEEGEAHE